MTAGKELRANLRLLKDPEGQLPPHDLKAERAVLAAMLLEPEVVNVALDVVGGWDAFHGGEHKIICKAIEALRNRKDPIDIVTVCGEMRDRGVTGSIPTMLAQLIDATPSVANVETHAAIVATKHRRRRAIIAAQTMLAEGYGDVGDEQAWLEACAKSLLEIARDQRKSTHSAIAEIMSSTLRSLDTASQRDGRITGISTGFKELDAHTGGIQQGDVYLVTGPTGRGKSAFSGNVAVNVASQGHGVAWFQLEDTKENWGRRAAAAEGRVDAKRIRQGMLTPDDHAAMVGAAGWIANLPIVIDDEKRVTPRRIAAKLSRIKADLERKGSEIKLAVIDNLQLVDFSEHGDPRNPEKQLDEGSKELGWMAEEMGIALLELAQLNEQGQVRGSRAISHHTPNWWDIERTAQKASAWAASGPVADVAMVKIRKQRHGEQFVDAAMWFHKHCVLFSDQEFLR